jgi:hypothetical protein
MRGRDQPPFDPIPGAPGPSSNLVGKRNADEAGATGEQFVLHVDLPGGGMHALGFW